MPTKNGSANAGAGRKEKKQIFICWSGDYSKQLAHWMKELLIDHIFKDTELKCFLSEDDIASGEDWWNKITKELKQSKMGILIITKENFTAPWIHFESGAMIGNKIKVVPLLFHVGVKALNDTPLSQKQAISFGEKTQFVKLAIDINHQFNLVANENMLKSAATSEYEEFRKRPEVKELLENVRNVGVFQPTYIYPSEVKNIERNSLYICASMQTMDDEEEYAKQNTFLVELEKVLRDKPFEFKTIVCPAKEIASKDNFDGGDKSIHENFIALKKVECCIVIYLYPKPSSTLIELGYALALGKKTVVFFKEQVPYIVQRMGENITHIKTFKFDKFEDIITLLKQNQKAVFKLEE